MITKVSNQTAVLALGGGGARGVAHLGVIEVLQNLPIDIQRYVGVSIGSLAGALCAVDPDIHSVQRRVIKYLTSEAFRSKQAALFSTSPPAEEPATSGLTAWYRQIMKLLGARRKLSALFSRPALLNPDVMQEIVDALLPDIDIAETTVPLTIVALDLYSGEKVSLTNGSLKQAVMASAAIPGVFPPIAWGNMLLCDIGMIDALPTEVAKKYGADLTIAVDVGAKVDRIEKCQTAAQVFMRLYDVGEPLMRHYSKQQADLVIRPDVAGISWYDFASPEELIRLGRVAASRYLINPDVSEPMMHASKRIAASTSKTIPDNHVEQTSEQHCD